MVIIYHIQLERENSFLRDFVVLGDLIKLPHTYVTMIKVYLDKEMSEREKNPLLTNITFARTHSISLDKCYLCMILLRI